LNKALPAHGFSAYNFLKIFLSSPGRPPTRYACSFLITKKSLKCDGGYCTGTDTDVIKICKGLARILPSEQRVPSMHCKYYFIMFHSFTEKIICIFIIQCFTINEVA
jgi:hypothetical protein